MQEKLLPFAALSICCEQAGRDGGVGEDVAQHRRHVGRDHARSLDDAGQRDLRPADHGAGRCALGKGVGRPDRLGGGLPAAGLGHERGGETLARLVLGQRHADDAGRAHKHLARRAAKMRRRLVHDLLDGLAPAIAGEGIGVAGVDDERARLAARDALAADLDLGRAAEVLVVTPATVVPSASST